MPGENIFCATPCNYEMQKHTDHILYSCHSNAFHFQRNLPLKCTPGIILYVHSSG